MLGEDAKYLTEEEEVGSFEIFGDRLYDRLQSVETYTGETVGRSEFEYLRIIQKIRDEHPDIFEKLKRLPKKARSGRKALHNLKSDALVTFIRKGQLKKFFVANTEEAKEVPFLDAMELLRCEDGEKKLVIPKQYYDFLETNKFTFDTLVAEDEDDGQDGRGRSNTMRIIQRLKTPEIRHCKQYTEEDEVFIRDVREALEEGRIPYKVTQRVRKAIETEADPLAVLRKLRKGIPSSFLIKDISVEHRRNLPREVILSVYLKEGN